MYLLTARHKLIDVLTHLPKDFRHAKSHLVSANVQRKVAVIVTKSWICTKICYTIQNQDSKHFSLNGFSKYEREVLKAIIFRKENGCLLSLSIGLDLIGLNQILQKKKFDQS